MTEKHRSDKRWLVEVSYRTEDGRRIDQHFIEELSDLDSIIEFGPNWNALIDCRITLNRRSERKGLTIEQAAAL